MSLNWQWEDKVGTIDIFNTDKVVTYTLYQGNAFLIMLYEYKEEGKDMYTMHNFFADKEHAKNCFGLTKGYENMFNTNYYRIKSIRLNKKKYRYTKDLVDMLIKAFDNIKIELYSEDDEDVGKEVT